MLRGGGGGGAHRYIMPERGESGVCPEYAHKNGQPAKRQAGCTLYQDAHCTKIHTVPRCTLYKDSHCTKMHSILRCTLYQDAH